MKPSNDSFGQVSGYPPYTIGKFKQKLMITASGVIWQK